MKKYNVTVNGTLYEVTLEVVEGEDVKAAAPAPASAPVSTPAVASAPIPEGAEKVSSPMPGTILAANVTVGSTVRSGDTLFVLEAMKMENEIMAPKDGKITAVNVTKGASVNSGDVLCVIE